MKPTTRYLFVGCLTRYRQLAIVNEAVTSRT